MEARIARDRARVFTIRGGVLLALLAAPLLILHVGSADLDVYRHGASVLLHGQSLYAPSFATGNRGHLPFTYPPFASIAALPLLPLPEGLTAVLWATATILMLFWCVRVSFQRLLDREPSRADWIVAILTAAFLVTRPVYDHLADGQVDIFLMTLCLADTLAARPRWPRGLLVGLATAIKLVPGIFIPYLWVTGRRKAAAFAAAVFVACEAIAAFADLGDSHRYWTHLLFDTERPGRTAGYKNQSLRGILLRVLAPQGRPILLAAAAAVIVVLGLSRARRATSSGDAVAGATLAGLTGVLASPVSWIHATVWIIPALGALVGGLHNRVRNIVAVVIAAVLFASLPYLPNLVHGLPRAAVVLLQRSFGLICLLLVVSLPVLRAPPPRADPNVAPI
ncbi:MAG TPA: glycosyltransferase 87 family protein [Acidimicrobiales bacterium]